MLNKHAYTILRLLLGTTFIWIGIMIWQDPAGWGGYIQPWALKLLLAPIREVMLTTAILDMVIGLLLIANRFTWLAAAVGSMHLLVVLITSGINEATVRDIGILAGTLALTVHLWPPRKGFCG